MGATEIYYFTASGNSLAVARDLAGKLDARLVRAVDVTSQERISTEADAVGFVFPIYDFKPPAVIEEVIRKLEGIESKYLFAVCTYGIVVAQSLRRLDATIRACGGHLAAGWGVAMPHNGVGSRAQALAQHEALFAHWKARLDLICALINARQEVRIESSSLAPVLFDGRLLKMLPYALKLGKQMLLKGARSLAFTPSASCDGCGVCARVCPAANIAIEGGKPAWADHCLNCFACLHWCPKGAISLGGLDMGIRQYHHPEVRLRDMLRAG